MKTADFNYDLPPHLIAQSPAEPRNSSRLLVMFDRQIVGDVPPLDDNIEQIGLLMTGEQHNGS